MSETVEQFNDKAEAIKSKFQAEGGVITNNIGDIVVANTKMASPVLTGALRRDITRKDAEKIEDGWQIEYGSNGIPYAQSVNDGHTTKSGKFVKGRHFMESGMQNSDKQIDETIEKWVTDLLKDL